MAGWEERRRQGEPELARSDSPPRENILQLSKYVWTQRDTPAPSKQPPRKPGQRNTPRQLSAQAERDTPERAGLSRQPPQAKHELFAAAAARLHRLLRLRDGDSIEVEQWGGPVQPNPGTAGTWFNVWRGTGTFLRLRSPWVALSKPAAIVEMLAEVERRDRLTTPAQQKYTTPTTPTHAKKSEKQKSGIQGAAPEPALGYAFAFAKYTGVLRAARTLGRKWPNASSADVVACALYTNGAPQGVCQAVGGWSKQQVRELYAQSEWLTDARRLELDPSECAARIRSAHGAPHTLLAMRNGQGDARGGFGRVRRGRAAQGCARESAAAFRNEGEEPGAGFEKKSEDADVRLNWLMAVCGQGCHFHPIDRPWAGWDGQLAILACALGVQAIILAAQPNDNGSPHTEVVDYDAPNGWPTFPTLSDALNPWQVLTLNCFLFSCIGSH